MGTLWIALRTLLWATVFLGFWAWLAYQAHLRAPPFGLHLPAWVAPIGIALVPFGAVVTIWSATTFVVKGRGTPAPFDAPREFVASGPYRHVRNPMYLGAAILLAGYALWAVSTAALLVPAGLLLAAHLFVVLYEEPALERRFGESYREYRRTTPRWIPRL